LNKTDEGYKVHNKKHQQKNAGNQKKQKTYPATADVVRRKKRYNQKIKRYVQKQGDNAKAFAVQYLFHCGRLWIYGFCELIATN
jgi:hypothetical protein